MLMMSIPPGAVKFARSKTAVQIKLVLFALLRGQLAQFCAQPAAYCSQIMQMVMPAAVPVVRQAVAVLAGAVCWRRFRR